MKKEESVEKAHPNSEGREDEEEEEEENTIEQMNNNNNKNKENHHRHHHHSFSPPESNSPSPSLHSLSNSPISNDHLSVVQPPLVTAHRFQVEPTVITKIDPAAEEGFVGVKGTTTGGGNRGLRPDVSSLLSKVLLGFRISAFVFCLVSFSVLAADQKKGWAQDSFFLYKEFRYSLTVNVIGFVYSGLQICDQAYYLITRKHIVEHMLRGYFTFALDQILTYLLMSASSSAATRAYDWESNWGHDKFPYVANASVVLSFIAFAVFALSSLVSGSIVCRFR